MTIKEAKEYIANSVALYLKKDEFGDYRIPIVRQRPIFLLGAPGIGKTAIMEQIAQEMGIALVSYSMTHHTRQSALGLPFIEKKNYAGNEYAVSEYTMSEIISSVYETMENSGIREGILFLDEINCVSETLAPSMLQFLQYKVFGRHSVPDGWVIVTAGNPPEYNKSVREFDVVTMDRLKLLEVEASYEVWREYAISRKVHNAILNYLDLKKEHFYVMETTAGGRRYVTARGWEDLSEILYLYEEEHLTVSEKLIEQYLHNETVVREFLAYYELYRKYKKDYRIGEILQGEFGEDLIARAKKAAFDERLSLLGMLMDAVNADMAEVLTQMAVLAVLQPLLKSLGEQAQADDFAQLLAHKTEAVRKGFEAKQKANALSDKDRYRTKHVLRFLENSANQDFDCIKQSYMEKLSAMKEKQEQTGAKLHNLFCFVEEAFADGNELLLLVTNLTVGADSAEYLSNFGSEDYLKHNSKLLLSERGEDIRVRIRELGL